MDVNSPGSLPKRSAIPYLLLNLITVGLVVAWLIVACYALIHLISSGRS